MSEDARSRGGVGRLNGGSAVGVVMKSAAIRNTVRGLLTSSTETSGSARTTPAGLAHMFGVCMLEMDVMSRGQKQQTDSKTVSTMPKFVDFRLTAQQKADFVGWTCGVSEMVAGLQRLCDSGYRVGCAWSGEQQAYTVSLTCKDPDSSNYGYCMTSFARELTTAIALALYKHEVLTGGFWVSEAVRDSGDFG